jgi:hypothetical protein
MSEKNASSIGPTSPSGESGTWSPGEGAAPLHKHNELLVTDGARIDDVDGPTTVGFRSGREGNQITVPYPEARYWSSSRIGSRGLSVASSVQPIILFDSGFAITADAGASFIQVS